MAPTMFPLIKIALEDVQPLGNCRKFSVLQQFAEHYSRMLKLRLFFIGLLKLRAQPIEPFSELFLFIVRLFIHFPYVIFIHKKLCKKCKGNQHQKCVFMDVSYETDHFLVSNLNLALKLSQVTAMRIANHRNRFANYQAAVRILFVCIEKIMK